MQKENYYSWVREVVQEQDVAKVNELLSRGYRLLSIKELSEIAVSEKGSSQRVFIVYILGRGEEDVWKKNPDGTEWAYVERVPQELVKKAESSSSSDGYVYWLTSSRKIIKRKKAPQ